MLSVAALHLSLTAAGAFWVFLAKTLTIYNAVAIDAIKYATSPFPILNLMRA
jgi:ABC-type glucose/galactose transport system permease subunit